MDPTTASSLADEVLSSSGYTESTDEIENPHTPNPVALNLQLTYLGIICILGAFGNIMVLVASLSHKELRSPANMFIVNLSFVDLLTNVMSIPVLMVSLKYNAWIFSNGMCHASAYIAIICLGQSVQSLAHIAGARYILITKPQRVYQKFCSWKAVFLNITFIWFSTIFIVIIPEFGFADIKFNPNLGLCSVDPQHQNAWIYTTILVAHSILSTLILIPCFYFTTCYTVMSSRRRIQQQNVFQRNVSRIEENLNFWKRELGLSKVLILTLLAYIICWVPFAVVHFLSADGYVSPVAQRVAILFLVTNSCINPYIYAVCNRKFRRVYRDLFYGLWYRVRPQSTTDSNSSQPCKERENEQSNVGILIIRQPTTSGTASSCHDNHAFRVTTSDA
ncbi:melatonin receptor type 1B-like [Diadema setosum]|uniref:melatonin receptor type 1B-like n=1 Tax=Diadema setosum TaxID=31175 RepID=UPI003B3A8922